MKKAIIILFIFGSMLTEAQSIPTVLHRGTIQFERKMNMYAQLDEMGKSGNKPWLDRMREQIDKYKIDKFEMQFTKEESLYQPVKDGIMELKARWINIPSERNIVYQNYQQNKVISQKEIYDKTILINDSLPKQTWKLKEEFRNIAGYNCRRAETIIMDSIWVVAFYTDAIIAPGGPESFNGLPGMILGVVMPRLNVTYFATDVKAYTDSRREISPPTKGKTYTNQSFVEYLKGNMKQWGDWMQRVLQYAGI
jgi:GLPGLI family protein